MRYTYVCLWLIGSVMAGPSYAEVEASSFDLEQCAKARDTFLNSDVTSPRVGEAMRHAADRHYALCVKDANRDAQRRAESQATRRLVADVARQKRAELDDELRRCMPRGDCNNEHLRNLASESVDLDLDAKYGR